MREFNHWKERQDAILRQQRKEDRMSYIIAIIAAAIIMFWVV